MVKHAALWGVEHTELGEVASTEVSASLAIALSRGRYAKGYRYLDPNEDVVFAATDDGVTLLAVADGHAGHDAATAAVKHLVADGSRLLGLARTDVSSAAVEAARDASVAIRDALDGVAPDRGRSRTTLSLALVSGEEVSVVQCGDSRVAHVREGKARFVGSVSPFLGPGEITDFETHTSTLRTGDRVIVASDGLFDFLGRDALDRVAELAGEGPAIDIVTRLVEAAFGGGAGDNVAVAALLVG